MTISKANWNSDGDNVRISMPFSKVDKERRIVSGFATLDNVDRQQDIVTAEASVKAFSKFRGNIREMHQPLAVGKMVAFKEDKYFDPESKKFYSGVYVSAYVSKGAQDTWEKVLDGTLSGFSIGGKMNKYDDAYDPNLDKTVRIIKDYDLVELSLVDTPANQFANILSVEKNENGVDMVKGKITETQIENVFWDADNDIVLVSDKEVENSPITSLPMQNIGFVEKADAEKTDMIKFLVESAKGIEAKMNKEGNPMNETTEDIVKNDDVVAEAQVAPEADATTEDAEVATDAPIVEDVEKSAGAGEGTGTGSEVEEDKESSEELDKTEVATEEVSKADAVAESVAEIKDTLTSAFSDLASTIKSLQEQVDVLSKSVDSVKNEVKESKQVFDEFGKRVDAVEADTAFRKSGDLGEIVQENEPEQVQKSLWGGRFLKTADLFR